MIGRAVLAAANRFADWLTGWVYAPFRGFDCDLYQPASSAPMADTPARGDHESSAARRPLAGAGAAEAPAPDASVITAACVGGAGRAGSVDAPRRASAAGPSTPQCPAVLYTSGRYFECELIAKHPGFDHASFTARATWNGPSTEPHTTGWTALLDELRRLRISNAELTTERDRLRDDLSVMDQFVVDATALINDPRVARPGT